MLGRVVSVSLFHYDIREVLSPRLLAVPGEPCLMTLSFARYFTMVSVTHGYVVSTVLLVPLSESSMWRVSGPD